MDTPRYRSVTVHWPRLIAGVAGMTVVISLSAAWPPLARAADPVWDSRPIALVAIGLLFALVVGFGRPTAEYELSERGIVKREGLFFSLLRRADTLPWEAVESADVAREMDGSRSLTLRTRHGPGWKVWEKFGTPNGFDAFSDAVAERLGHHVAAPFPIRPRVAPTETARENSADSVDSVAVMRRCRTSRRLLP